MATGGAGHNRPFDDRGHHHETFTSSSLTNYPHSLRTRGTSPYAPNRATTINPTPSLHRRPPIPEVSAILPFSLAKCVTSSLGFPHGFRPTAVRLN